MFSEQKKKLFQQELDLMLEKKLAEIATKEANEYKNGEKQKHDYECEWHTQREKLIIEIATLDGKRQTLKESESLRGQVLVGKDEEIKYLQGVIAQMIEKNTFPKIVECHHGCAKGE